MNVKSLNSRKAKWGTEVQWSVRYLGIYDLPAGLAQKLVDNIINDIMVECGREMNGVYDKDIFYKKLKFVVNELKSNSYAA